jgi:outer membrane lipoprotein-sorting protein
MTFRLKIVAAAAAALFFALASDRAGAADGDKAATIAKLNAAAKSFHTTVADFTFETVQTDPVPDTDVMKGTSYYERSGNNFKMAAHIDTDNSRPAPKVYTFADGVFKLYEPGIHQVTTFQRASDFAAYIMLGFGASGDQLADKWDITDLGPEPINGVLTEKLELVAKDATVREHLPKVTIWMDLNRAVSLKQIFDQGHGQTRTCSYTNISQPRSIPADRFTFKTDKNTQYINR